MRQITRRPRSGRMGLQPRGVDRLRSALRPGWSRTVAARRALAGALAAMALILAATSRPGGPTDTVVAAARELTPGVRLAATDVRMLTVPAGLVPHDALRGPGDAVGRT
ncbi:SAF domain-containing protein, partial [Tsukamurella soli]